MTRQTPRWLYARMRRNRDYRLAFGTEEGARVLEDLLRHCHAGEVIHVPGDPYETAFRDGQRRVALRIVSILNMNNEKMLRLAMSEPEQDEIDL